MRIDVRTTSPLRSLTEYVKQHARLRFEGLQEYQVRHVEARVFHDGDTYKTCRMVVELAPPANAVVPAGVRIIVTEATCEDPFDAVDYAVEKVLARIERDRVHKERPSGVRLSDHTPLESDASELHALG